MKLELASKSVSTKDSKGHYTWEDFFKDILKGEGEVAVEFIEIDRDREVKNHQVLFTLGKYCYEWIDNEFHEQSGIPTANRQAIRYPANVKHMVITK